MNNYQPYMHGSVAYRQTLDSQEQWAPREAPRQRVDVIPGGAKDRVSQKSPQHELALKVAKLTVAAVMVFAGIGFGRVSFSAATVAEALDAREVTRNLEDARSSINELEVIQSSLSNPTRIKNEAAALGMASSAESIVLDLTGDVVVKDAAGNLSLTGSVDVMVDGEKAAAAAAETQAAMRETSGEEPSEPAGIAA